MEYWVGVDLDGTLAEVDYSKPYDYRFIGKPVPDMVERIKDWVANGRVVKILTARVSSNCPEKEECIRIIQAWCMEHLGFTLEVTSEKDYWMSEFWDDRCIQVIQNTGMPVRWAGENLITELNEAETKAWDALKRYKFQMFGYWAAIWVHLNRISGQARPNPWKELVQLSRSKK